MGPLIRDLVQIALAVVLIAAALAKLARPAASAEALGTFGLTAPRARAVALGVLVAAELAVAGLLIAGVAVAPYLAAALFGGFAAALGLALRAGRAGEPCGCLGPRSTVSAKAAVRALVLAAVALAVPALPADPASTDTWLGVGLAVAGLAILALAVAVAALAREVGRLRLAVGPESALEIPHEGPGVGDHLPALGNRFSPGSRAILALAVFESEGCHMCQRLAPSVDAFAREPILAVERFDEVRDADVWRELGIPGSPFAVVLSLDSTVLAKGTFNSPGQLEGLLATAERRAAEEVPA
jgi:hypothetical protein